MEPSLLALFDYLHPRKPSQFLAWRLIFLAILNLAPGSLWPNGCSAMVED